MNENTTMNNEELVTTTETTEELVETNYEPAYQEDYYEEESTGLSGLAKAGIGLGLIAGGALAERWVFKPIRENAKNEWNKSALKSKLEDQAAARRSRRELKKQQKTVTEVKVVEPINEESIEEE